MAVIHTCKQRRVKVTILSAIGKFIADLLRCDEQGPPCTRCVAREVTCHYSPRTTKNSQQSSALVNGADIPAHFSNPESPSFSPDQHLYHGQPPAATTRLLELELLHQYSTKTYKGLALLSADQQIWQDFAVEEAMKFDFLMKEIFALAALHKATEMPDFASKYVNCALELKNEALSLSHDALRNINQENSDALFMFSIMTMIFAIVPPLSVPGIDFKSPLENLLVLFEFQKGTASVAHFCPNWLDTSRCRWIFGSTDNTVKTNESFNTAITRLKHLNDNYTTTPPSDSEIFSNAINSLSFCSVGSRGRVPAWLAMAGQDFPAKLREEDPMALLILIHWAVLFETLSDLWWAKNAGKRLVEDVMGVLEKVTFNSNSPRRSGWAEAVGWARWEVSVRAGD